jgi:adenosylcobinamide kinase/adenosylcobinamide-phosphate guanylyltransferase
MAMISTGLTLLIGGARSGKSALATRIAAVAGETVTFVATAEALWSEEGRGDADMTARIAAHRLERPVGWETVEDPRLDLDTLAAIDADRFIVVDCLTLWVANRLEESDEAVVAHATAVAESLRRRETGSVVVSNEVGSGIVPFEPATRRYRDLLGRVNIAVASVADRTLLVVAGRVVELGEPDLG